MRNKRRFVILVLAFALIGAGIWLSGRTPGFGHTDQPNLTGPPSITGLIDVEKSYGGNFLIVPAGKSFQDSVSIGIRPEAKVSRRDGKPVIFKTGQIVSVWCSGPIADSKPPRWGADMVVIESDGN
jgi:hypothetical protein